MSDENRLRHTNDLALEALISANNKLVRERRKTGETLVIWKDGKVVEVPASEIELPEDKIKNVL